MSDNSIVRIPVGVGMVRSVDPNSNRRVRRGGPTGIRAQWLKDIAALNPDQEYVMKIDGVDNREDFDKRCASLQSSVYRKNKDGSRAVGFDANVHRDFENRQLVITRSSN